MNSELLRLEGVAKGFPSPDGKGFIKILDSIDLTLNQGEVISIVGQSGSGKSTLLSVAALLTKRDGGRIEYSGRDVDLMNEKEISELRSRKMGFVFQSSLLLEDFSALENVAMPLMIQGMKRKDAFRKAEEYLGIVGLLDRKKHRPKALSGGERQRIAIARALAPEPDIVYADEPTGSLDEANAAMVEDLLLNAVRESGKGMILVTHNTEFASRADRKLILKGGCLV